MKKHLWSLLTRLVDSYCDQTQMLEGTLEPFCDVGPLLAGGEVDMGRQNERGGICVDTISGPSVLTACHKFQAETKSVKANIISCFQFVPLQKCFCFYPCLSSISHCHCEFLLWYRSDGHEESHITKQTLRRVKRHKVDMLHFSSTCYMVAMSTRST